MRKSGWFCVNALTVAASLLLAAADSFGASAIAWNATDHRYAYSSNQKTVEEAEKKALTAAGGGTIVHSGEEQGWWAVAVSYPGASSMCKDASTPTGVSFRCGTAVGFAYGRSSSGEAQSVASINCVQNGGDEFPCSQKAFWLEHTPPTGKKKSTSAVQSLELAFHIPDSYRDVAIKITSDRVSYTEKLDNNPAREYTVNRSEIKSCKSDKDYRGNLTLQIEAKPVGSFLYDGSRLDESKSAYYPWLAFLFDNEQHREQVVKAICR